MKTQGRTKGWTVLGALLLLGSLTAGTAQAATTDSLTVTITPNAAYAVDVDTGTGALLDLGTVDLGVSTFTVGVTTVEVRSSYATTDLSIRAEVISGGWSIDADTTTQETDALQSWAVFTDTGVVSAAVAAAQSGAFGANDLLQTTNRDVGQVGAGPRMYELVGGDTGYKDMEDLPSFFAGGASIAQSRSHLWLKFTLPPVASAPTIGTPQRIYVTVTAAAPN